MAKSLIGLDIGTNNVKAVELTENGKELILKHVGFAVIEAIADLTNDEDRHKAVLKAIKAALPPGSLKNKKVSTALSGKSVIIRTISLPKGPVQRLGRDEIKKMIMSEIEAEIPFPIEEAVLDFFILDDLSVSKDEKARLMVAVVPKVEVDKNIALIREAGVEHEAIDVVPLALMRGITELKTRLNVEIMGIVDLGAATTEVVVVKQLEMLFTRNIPLGGNLLTRMVQDVLNFDYARAESSKVKEGLPPTVAPQFERIATEIRNSLSYFQLQEHKKIDLVFICGGGAKLKDVGQFLKEKIDIPLETANPLETIKNALKNIPIDFLTEIAPYLITAIGLAIKQKKSEKRLNLLPEELRKESFPLKSVYAGATVFTVISLLLIYVLLNMKIKQINEKIGDLNKAMTNLQRVVARTKEAKIIRDEAARQEAIVNTMFGITPPFAKVLKEIAAELPSTVWLREVIIKGDSVEKAQIDAKGKKVSASPPALKLSINGVSLKTQGAAEYMLNLQKIPYFKNFDLTGAKAAVYENVEGVAWSFDCQLSKGILPASAEVKK